ncbi:protein phosphatase CheZ [Azospira inquinata]|uniref:Protein phosphatase CheZ n=1 Tax=Azospira inquinata TaxID=2785627 RepID=A0A975SLA0_9RHOO|nr:protein phosphatase CheZ [Azospira inquinata]QWT46286.1 protein phosphatase CheZ [Azospira inquinata]QWT48387.1 protein phosphatase CheZ [Azospira inquinata]
MNETTEITGTGDSADLEALFDSIAATRDEGAPAAPAAPVAAPTPAPAPAAASSDEVGDSDELQALFDSVASTAAHEEEAPAASPIPAQPVEGAPAGEGSQDRVFKRIGVMARELHDTLHELGYDKLLEKTVHAIPDAKDRLAYVANLTEQAACRVLNATDIAKPLQDELESSSKTLASRWDALYENKLSVAEFKALADETRAFLKDQVPQKAAATNEQLLEIMMAQDFQDLTGQVIKKIVGLAQNLENQLVQVLVDVIPDARRNDNVNSLINGPVISGEGRTDVVVNQQQVDDLLGSLGF